MSMKVWFDLGRMGKWFNCGDCTDFDACM